MWTSDTYHDVYLGKFNSSGNGIWNSTVNGPRGITDKGLGVVLDNNSNIYVVGQSAFNASTNSYDIY